MPMDGNPGLERAAPGWCTIVVPCYNEAQRLKLNLFSEFLAHCSSIRFLFVNDGSRDDTLSVLRRFCNAFPDSVEVLDKPLNGGKAEAVRDGMRHVIDEGDATFVGFWDADLATPLEAIPELLKKLIDDPQVQMVFGSRVRLLGRHIHRQAVRHYLGRVFATVVSTLLRLPIYDTQCGAKIFRVNPELAQVLSKPFLSRWVFDVEILARFLALHKRNVEYARRSIYEVPLDSWEDVAGSKVSPFDFLHAFGDLMKIYKQYLASG